MKFSKLSAMFFQMSRSERNGVVVLLILIVVAALVRFFISDFISDEGNYDEIINEKIEKLEALNRSTESAVANANYNQGHSENNEKLSNSFFNFDPNTISYPDLIMLGFTGKEANTLINYREKGGFFNNAEDLLKLYNINKEHFEKIKGYVVIERQRSYDSHISNKQVSQKESAFSTIIEINSADSSLFEGLKGIGPVLSSRICKYRDKLGGFYSIDQIAEVYQFPSETLEQIKPQLTIDTTLIVRININFSSYNELRKHPYINNELARKLVDYRSRKGSLKSVYQLKSDSIISVPEFNRLYRYFTVN